MSPKLPCGLSQGCSRWLVAYSMIFGFVSHVAMAQVDATQPATEATASPSTPARAATSSSDKIKEITVTAERRRESLQKVAATVAVVTGAEILSQGKITIAQMLEDVPNVIVGFQDTANNIIIRGVATSATQGGIQLPATVASYVDDVYGGIGQDFDISRVEVLYGPQGTLYGRSATGGVVAYHTADPQLGKWGGFVSGEYGTADLRQVIAAVNIPILPQIAMRVAARQFDQHGYFDAFAGAQRDQEARVKVLYQPMSNLSFLAAWTINENHSRSGGASAELTSATGPDTIIYNAGYSTPVEDESRYHQYSLTTKYDFGYGTATYIGALHDYDQNSLTSQSRGNQVLGGTNLNPLNQTHTEELRIASDSSTPLTWLVGANFYANMTKQTQGSTQVSADTDTIPEVPDTTPGVADALVGTQISNSRIFDYGLFTQETYSILPNLRITAGGRLDESKVSVYEYKVINLNEDTYGNYLNPADNLIGTLQNSKIFRNFTYKARIEYDVAPQHLLYASVSTGFLPGQQELAIVQNTSGPPGSSGSTSLTAEVLPYTQEILHSYEIGSKNRFFNSTLQINGDIYLEHYSGYQITANPAGNVCAMCQTVFSVPLDNYGGELSMQWKITPADLFTFTGGITDAEIPGQPTLAGIGAVGQYIQRRLSGVIPEQATGAYSHTFTFADGSTLVPRAQARFYGAYNVTDLTISELEAGDHAYVNQGATVVADVDLGWTSANMKYSIDGYVRNIANNIFKAQVVVGGGGGGNGSVSEFNVEPSNPRVAGVVVTAKF